MGLQRLSKHVLKLLFKKRDIFAQFLISSEYKKLNKHRCKIILNVVYYYSVIIRQVNLVVTNKYNTREYTKM